jgi:hypothetical protein
VAAGSLLALAGACTVPPPPITPGDPGVSDIQMTITSNVNVHGISPFIYGTNGATNLAANRQTVVRMGGNRWTAYNWENNASNAGSDWCFQNDGLLSASNTPGDAVKPTITQAKNAGAAAIVTIPIVDYVAADKNGGCDVRNSGANYLQTRFKQNLSTKPSALSLTPNAGDGVVYEDEYVNWVKQAVPGANVVFSLDNEPDLWSSTHAEVHPTAVGYTELANRNIDYASAIKRVWPSAKVTGPVNYGFYGFETLQNAPDAAGKGVFLDWYLDRMKAAGTTAGLRLVDDLDLHWYPEATGGGVRITGTDTSAAVVAAREQAPRSLWDPTYVETSWITSDYGYGAIRLIPRTKDRIAAHYPGTGLAFTEWTYGGGGHISGAIACSDVLGIFGREGVDLATYWPLQSDESYAYGAFAAFRNYDGAGGHFGDTSVRATTTDTSGSSVYAAIDAANHNRVVIVAINKATTAKTTAVKVTGEQVFGHAKTYTLTGASSTPQAGATLTSTAQNAFLYTMPAQSVTVIVPTT